MSDVGNIAPQPGGDGIASANPDDCRGQVGGAFEKSGSGTVGPSSSADTDILQVGMTPGPRWNRPDAIPALGLMPLCSGAAASRSFQ
jgi:hypothetical protein